MVDKCRVHRTSFLGKQDILSGFWFPFFLVGFQVGGGKHESGFSVARRRTEFRPKVLVMCCNFGGLDQELVVPLTRIGETLHNGLLFAIFGFEVFLPLLFFWIFRLRFDIVSCDEVDFISTTKGN